jgi:arylsulfatase A-like enzyme
VGIASLEAHGYFLTQGADTSLPFREFLQCFSNTCGILLVATSLAWLLIWFFMVWLGGVRSGMALFFMIFFLPLLGYLVVVLDVVFTHTTKYAAHWALLMKYFAGFALLVAALSSMILGKIFRRFRPPNITSRTFMIAVVLFMGTAFAVWARNARFPQVQGNHFWGSIAAAAIVITVLFWWFGRTPRRLGLSLAALFVLVFAPLPVAFFSQPPSAAPDETIVTASHPVRHVILITIDTLRQDSLGAYNSNAPGSPHIDQFARDTVVFTNAFSPSPWTYPSLASILTGLAPGVHHLVESKYTLPDKVPTMAEAMTSAGYCTAAIGLNSMLLPRSGLGRGFQEYHWFPQPVFQVGNFRVGLAHNLLDLCGSREPDAAQLTNQAIQWLGANAKQDFFLWVHYFDPHMPYMPPEAFQPTDPAQRELGNGFEDIRGARMGALARTANGRAWIRALHDGEVRYVDEQVGRLVESLRKQGLYDDALIVFTSDHGEEFWDHDHFEHGHTLYNELVLVPLLLKLPGSPGHRTIDTRVTTQAVMPTILDLCAVAPQSSGILLPPLSPLVKGEPDAYVEQPVSVGASLFFDHLEGVLFDQMKYIRGTLSGHEQLFNLSEDPRERNSIAVQDPQNLEKGRKLLDDARAADSRLTEQLGIQPDQMDRLNQEDVRSLQAQGYL